MVAIGALAASVLGGRTYLKPLMEGLLNDAELAMLIATGLPAVAALLLLLLAYQALRKQPRLLRAERFDLRVRNKDDLLGREVDVADLKAMLNEYALVFLDGESGSGKSALARHGLLPALTEGGDVLPVLVFEYGGDWDRGLANKTYLAVWNALNVDQRERLGIAGRPSVGTIDGPQVAALLRRVATDLGLSPILIFDQFDDYQLTFRSQFLDAHRAWISADQLRDRNAFWRSIDLVRADHGLAIMVITRSDTSAGLHSARFTEASTSRTLTRLNPEWLPKVFAQLTREDDKGPVIENPEAGWVELQRLLETDLQRNGAVLPQQVRVTLLGLRKLGSLTPRSYRRAGGTTGVEALYVRDAIQNASLASGEEADTIRRLLLMFVERGPDNAAKTVWRAEAQLADVIPDRGRLTRVLEKLEAEEIVRARPGVESESEEWQLDHDYLARSALAEERAANRFVAVLRDGAEAWSNAGSDVRQRIRTLLPLRSQFALALEKLRSRGRFTYRPYRTYAAWSLLRVVPIALVLALGGAVSREILLQNEARTIVDALSDQTNDPLYALWTAPPSIRDKAASILINGERLKTAGNDWVNAYVSLEPEAAARLAWQLVHALTRSDIQSDRLEPLSMALDATVPRLSRDDAAKILAHLRKRAGEPRSDIQNLSYFLSIAYVGKALSPQEAGTLADELLSWPESNGNDARKALPLQALTQVAETLEPAKAAALWTSTLRRTEASTLSDERLEAYQNALGALAKALSPEDAQTAFADLGKHLAGEKEATRRSRILFLMAVVAQNLQGPDAMAATDFSMKGVFDINQTFPDRMAWYEVLAAASAKIPDAMARQVAEQTPAMSKALLAGGDSIDFKFRQNALVRNLAPRLDSNTAVRVIGGLLENDPQPWSNMDLRILGGRVERSEAARQLALHPAWIAAFPYGIYADRPTGSLTEAQAKQQVYDLLADNGMNSRRLTSLGLKAMVDPLSPGAAADLAQLARSKIRGRLETGYNPEKATLYGALSARAGEQAAERAVGYFLRAWDENEGLLSYTSITEGLKAAAAGVSAAASQKLAFDLVERSARAAQKAHDGSLADRSDGGSSEAVEVLAPLVPKLSVSQRQTLADKLRALMRTPGTSAARQTAILSVLVKIADSYADPPDRTPRPVLIDLIMAVACPIDLGEERRSAWKRLDQIAGEPLDQSELKLIGWARKTHAVGPAEVRGPRSRGRLEELAARNVKAPG
ncbi:MAG: hypothetical protein JWR84_1831 [Caulobacter sp.]|nr:hypothetical protein [Caulobacter sp.]